ncbi:MAG: DNA repair protein RecO [Pseudomonadota bacterium]
MEWREQGVLLSVRPHGETAAIIEVLTEARGRHAGIVRGGNGRRIKPILQPGAQLDLTWRARLEDHLGSFTAEPVFARAALMSDRLALAGLSAATALIRLAWAERQAHPALYRDTEALLDRMEVGDEWLAYYVGWELHLLSTLGFGLDLRACAVTGATEELIYVSPKSGRAVGAVAGADWSDRLLPLPAFLRPEVSEAPITAQDLRDGLRTSGYFLTQWLFPALNKSGPPPARDRLLRAVNKLC